MRIFFICHRVPYPPDRGDKIATFNMLRHLSSKHEVHVFCLSTAPSDDTSVSALECYAQQVTAVRVSGFAKRVRAVAALYSGRPISVVLANEPRLHEAVATAARNSPPDLILVYSSDMAQFAVNLGAAPRFMYFSDLDSQKWRLYGEKRGFPLNWIYRREGRLLADYERQIAHSFSHSFVCTEAEKRDFEKLIPGVPVSVSSNGVDLEYFSSMRVIKKRGTLIFTGVMNYFPNIDAVSWFCKEIFPRIKQQIPFATFVICGKDPAPAVKRLADHEGVIVTGAVPDVRPYLDAAEISVVPLRIARGIQNKLLEGLAMGLPCISSRCSWEGTNIDQGAGVLVADDADQFVEHAIHLLQDEKYRTLQGQLARVSVEEKHTWASQLRLLDEMIGRAACARELPALTAP